MPALCALCAQSGSDIAVRRGMGTAHKAWYVDKNQTFQAQK